MDKYKPIFAGVAIVIIFCSLILYIQSSPKLQARSLLVDAVGEDYFKSFMELKGVQSTSLLPPRSTVVYDYYLQVSNYSTTCEVRIFFDWMNRFRRSMGVPSSDNLMPFNVLREEAISIAIETNFKKCFNITEVGNRLVQLTQRYVEVEAEILFVERSVNDVPVNRYVWHVVIYLTEKSALSGSLIEVLIDLYSGEVIDVAEIRWTSTP